MFRVSRPWLVLALALGMAGGATYALADGTVQTLSLGLIGLAVVVAVSALFYAVGVSEDRERERRR
jgi:hypothetical protein